MVDNDATTLHSEGSLIADFLRPLTAGFAGALSLADDCATLAPAPGQEIVLKCDPVRASVHFFVDDDPADIAWKALAANVSDLAAKAARPVCYLMALSFPEPPQTGWIKAFATGLAEAQQNFGIVLAGGDTDRAPGPLSITITVLGEVPSGGMVRRAAAQVGDVLFVSGTLGDAALGLALRQDPAGALHTALEPDAVRYLLRRYHRPEPRLGLKAALRNYAHASMDISDGLAKDLGRMVTASSPGAQSIGAAVRLAGLPLSAPFHTLLATGQASFSDAIAHGDDYEVLAAVPPDAAADFAATALAGGVRVSAIGAIRPESGIDFFDAAGAALTLNRSGYDHF